MSRFAVFTCVLLLLTGLIAQVGVIEAQNAWSGNLKLELPDTPVNAGQSVNVTFNSFNRDKANPAIMKNRKIRFFMASYRWSLLNDEAVELEFRRTGDSSATIQLPRVAPGWYLIYAQAENDQQAFVSPGTAIKSKQEGPRFTSAVLAVRGNGPLVRVHTEFTRVVFSPGEMFRVYVSGKQARGSVELKMKPKGHEGKTITIAKGNLNSSSKTQTLAFDISRQASRSLAAGDYELQAVMNGQVLDSYPIQMVNPERYGAGSRIYQGGNSNTSSAQIHPWSVDGNKWWLDKQAQAHRAEQRIQVFSNAFPMANPGRNMNLPAFDQSGMPPAEAYFRPSFSYAMMQAQMARGIGVNMMIGGWELGSENYMPTPTIEGPELDIMARKYLIAGLSLAHYPNFTGLYTDAYARPAFWGAGELTGQETQSLRERLWAAGWKFAGRSVVPTPPYRFIWNSRDYNRWVSGRGVKMPKDVRAKFNEAWKAMNARYKDKGGIGRQSEAVQLREWFALQEVIGMPRTEPGRHYPMPRLPDTIQATDDERYKFTYFIQSGFGRNYGAISRMIESELPAVYTIHNRRRENHRTVGYAWRDWSKSPSIPPEPSFGGPTVVFSSEFNLDQEPQPYSNPTAYTQSNRDKGQPVWASANGFQFAGSNSRFMRDAIHFLGRGVTPVYHNPKGWTWSHRGSDQSTYAAYDRLNSVTHFLSMYEDLFTQLKPIKEVGLYMGPFWAGPNSYSSYVAIPAGHMTGHQVHVLSHYDADKGGFDDYKVIFAPGLPWGPRVSHIKQAFKDFENRGGKIVGSPAQTRYYGGPEFYNRYGITTEVVPVLDNNGNPRKNRDGSPRTKTIWKESPQQRQKITREYVWEGFRNVEIVPYDFSSRDSDEDRIQQAGHLNHWTGYHQWSYIRGAMLASYGDLKAALDRANPDPLVKKSEKEVFVSAAQPRDPEAKGFFLFVANFSRPDDAAWTSLRVPWLFWPTFSKPVACELKVKGKDVAVVYDLIKGKEIPFTREGDRVVFTADLGSVEGRVYALYPERIASAELQFTNQVKPGDFIQPRFTLKSSTGQDMPVMGAVRIKLSDAQGRVLLKTHRSIKADGLLPVLRVPGNASGQLQLEVLDLLSAQQVNATLNVSSSIPVAGVADPVTVYRPTKIHEMLKKGQDKLYVIVDDGNINWKSRKVPDPVAKAKADAAKKKHDENEKRKADEAKKKKKKYKVRKFRYPKIPEITEHSKEIVSPNPNLAMDRKAGEQLVSALRRVGVNAELTTSTKAYERELWGYPFHGSRAAYRGRFTMPNRQVTGRVIFVGSMRGSRMISDIQRYQVAQRSLASENTSNGRAVLSWLPRGFSAQNDAVILVASDQSGFDKGISKLAEIASRQPSQDPFYQAREKTRHLWLGADIARYKTQMNVLPPKSGEPIIVAGSTVVNSQKYAAYRGVEDDLGPAIFTIDAGPNGIAVGTKSLARPLVLVSNQGKILMSAGGGKNVMPRDVAVSENGKVAVGGFALEGTITAFDHTGREIWTQDAGIVSKDKPLGWDTWKNSERFLGVTPDQTIAVMSAGNKGMMARELNTGRVLWTIPSFSERAKGMASPEIPVSPDGRYALIKSDKKVGEEPVMHRGKPRMDENGKPIMKSILEQNVKLVEVRSGRVMWTAPANLSDWELYASVGPNGAWSITGGRSPKFGFRGPKGETLRIFNANQLPKALDVGAQIAPQYLSATNPSELLMYTPQSKRLYLMEIKIGSASQIAEAERLQAENKAMARRLKEILSDRKQYKTWNAKKVDQIMAEIVGPSDIVNKVKARMRQVPSELRAKRKRDFRFFQNVYNEFVVESYLQDKAKIEASLKVAPKLEIQTPDMVNNAVLSTDGKTLYVSLWDHTVRAYDLSNGQEKWSTKIIGGAQLDFVKPNLLYAGGSRADLYQINADNGQINWTVNVTQASGSMVSGQ